jgi:hypothetical protein
MNRLLLGYNPDFDAFDTAEPMTRVSPRRNPLVLNNVDTMSLSIDLLEVGTSSQLGSAIRRIVRRAGEAVNRPLNEAAVAELSDLLEVAARYALPKQPPSMAPNTTDARARGRFFGLELEGLSPEDQEFETAKAFVRLASEATRQATLIARHLTPRAAANAAVAHSARRYAPGWARRMRPAATGSVIGPNGSVMGARYALTS